MKAINTAGWPVMAKQCATCVFRVDAKGRWIDPDIARVVEERMWTCSQICHHPALHGKKQTHLCRGVRNKHIEIMHRMGFLHAPTDAAWEAKRKELGV